MRRARLSLPLLALVAGCIPRPEPSPAPAPRPAPPPVVRPALPAPLAADWRDWPVTPGDWVYRRDERGSVALFGPRGSDALLVLRCDLGRRALYLSLPGAAPATVTMRTSSVARTLSLAPTGGTPPYLAVAFQPGDRLLDAMGFSRGRFAIERPGPPPLVVPAWAEIERVTEDCRP